MAKRATATSRTALAVLVAVVAASCGAGGGPSPSRSNASATTAPPVATAGPAASTPPPSVPVGPGDLGAVRVRLQEVADIDAPVAMAVRGGDDALYVAEQGGKIVALRDGSVDPEPVLDVSEQITAGGEQGLLGLAFGPDGGFLYVNYTDLEGNTNVVEFAMGADGRASVGSRREVLFVKQPYPNHNGGNLAFGPDGYLYIGLGDGGSGGDPQGNGQSLGTLLGKMLRIDPRPGGSAPSAGGGYGVPDDNPFVGRPGARPEIWAYGLRNPWRYSFDRDRGDLWIGDVGQSAWEEIDHQPAGSSGGQNYGWNRREGVHPYQGSAPQGAVPPVYEYSHDGGGCAVDGGYVYRGAAIPGLWGAYVFGDYCLGEVMAFHLDGETAVEVTDLGLRVDGLSSFGQDANGELYALSLGGAVYRIVEA